MLLLVLLSVAAGFLLLFGVRVGGARRAALLARWPAVLLALAALLAAARGAIWPAIVFAALAVLTWVLWPSINRARKNQQPASDPADVEAARLLGVTLQSTESDIRAAYRAKMARAHPDRGGSTNEAARLTAARDRLLRRLKG